MILKDIEKQLIAERVAEQRVQFQGANRDQVKKAALTILSTCGTVEMLEVTWLEGFKAYQEIKNDDQI